MSVSANCGQKPLGPINSRNGMSAKQVALYGLGNMGYLVAERIAKQFPVQVADLNQAAVERARQEFAANPVQTPEDLAQTRVVVLCLPSPAASQAVLTQIAPHLPKDAVVVEASPVNPSDIPGSEDVRLGKRCAIR